MFVGAVTSFATGVFPRENPQQNGMLLLTPVSDSVFIALSDGTIHFSPHGNALNHDLIGSDNSTAKQGALCWWL